MYSVTISNGGIYHQCTEIISIGVNYNCKALRLIRRAAAMADQPRITKLVILI